MNLIDPITLIPGVGDSYAKRLVRLNIQTVADLLNHFPRLHLDYSQSTPIAKIQASTPVCIKATLDDFNSIRTRGKLTIQKASISDETGNISLTWFNQPYLKDSLKLDHEYFFTGQADIFQNRLVLNNPDFEPVKANQVHTKRIIPIYSLTAGITQKWLRHKIHLALQLTKVLEIFKHPEFIDLDLAFRQIHFPNDQDTLKKAKQRLAFNDLLSLYLKSALTKKSWEEHGSTPIKLNNNLHKQLLDSLPYKLTPDQTLAIAKIFTDLTRAKPMNRLLQGDVGTGKTIIAIATALQCIQDKLSVVVMAPTQVLAQQHYETFTKILKPFKIKPILITSSTKNYELKTKNYELFIGTHALLHRDFPTKKVGLIVVDEQHRFGVLQRSHFLNNDLLPHCLTMSATPIPRTIALSLYGHLDISDIKTQPQDRKQIKTWVVPESKRTGAYDWIKKELNSGHQAFVICPLIEESEHETLKNVASAKKEFEKLKTIFKAYKLALLHGKLKPKEKDKILLDFKKKKYNLLISTPVIEVGIDIPNANIIVIEGSERFGLASLHQLRGRVGRGEAQSYCLLFSSSTESLGRLKLLERYHNGLDLARLDLKIRGSGEIFGTSQSGHLDTQFQEFWQANLRTKAKQFAKTLIDDRVDAHQLLEQLNPELAKLSPPN